MGFEGQPDENVRFRALKPLLVPHYKEEQVITEPALLLLFFNIDRLRLVCSSKSSFEAMLSDLFSEDASIMFFNTFISIDVDVYPVVCSISFTRFSAVIFSLKKPLISVNSRGSTE